MDPRKSELVQMVGLSSDPQDPVFVDVTQRSESLHWKVLVKRGEMPLGVMLLSLFDHKRGAAGHVVRRELKLLNPIDLSDADIDFVVRETLRQIEGNRLN